MSVLEDARQVLTSAVDGISFGSLDDWRGLHFEAADEFERVDVVCQHGTVVVGDLLGGEPDEAECLECDAMCCDRCTRHLPCGKHEFDYDDSRAES